MIFVVLAETGREAKMLIEEFNKLKEENKFLNLQIELLKEQIELYKSCLDSSNETNRVLANRLYQLNNKIIHEI